MIGRGGVSRPLLIVRFLVVLFVVWTIVLFFVAFFTDTLRPSPQSQTNDPLQIIYGDPPRPDTSRLTFEQWEKRKKEGKPTRVINDPNEMHWKSSRNPEGDNHMAVIPSSPIEAPPEPPAPPPPLPVPTHGGSASSPVVVVLWDSMSPWTWGQGPIVETPNYAGYVVKKDPCPVQCHFTGDRNYLDSADVVLFDVCLTGPTEYRDVPIYLPEKREGQLWVWFAYEQQYYFPIMQEKDYMNRFDHKMTYDPDSLVQVTYTCPWGDINTFLDPPPKKSSDKIVVLMASNCNTGGADKRTAYVEELMKYIKVDSYGGCLHNTDMKEYQRKNGRRSHGDKIIEKIGIISEYKFLLTFENNNMVPNYVTEKLTNAYQAGTVPVYWGGSNVDAWTIGEKSLIKASVFASPRELAEYLHKLNNDDKLYMEYFEWKKKGISPQYQKLLDNCIFYAECRYTQLQWNTEGTATLPKVSNEIQAYALQLNRLDTRHSREDQYVTIPPHPALNLEDNFSFAAWINLNLIHDGRIIDKGKSGDPKIGYSFDVLQKPGLKSKGVLRFCGAGGCYEGSRPLSVGIWYHVGMTFSNSPDGLKFYVNGKLDAVRTPNDVVKPSSNSLTFGRASVGAGAWRPYHPNTIFDGILDDISIWQTVLSEKEIWDLMFRRLSGTERYLVGYWGFNEGYGNQVKDSGPNKLHGAIVGGATWVKSIAKPLNDIANVERDL